MKGKVPTYFVGKRTTLPRVRVLIQEERPATKEELKELGYKGTSGWISLGGFHIMSYGMSRREVFETVYLALQHPELGTKKAKELEKEIKQQVTGFRRILRFLHRKHH